MLERSAAIAAPLVALAACGSGGGGAKPAAKIDAGIASMADAAPTSMRVAPVPVPVPMAPDDQDSAAPRGSGTRHPRMLALTLESTPNHAIVEIDGVDVGETPTYWEGEFTGHERVFKFRLTGYTPAVYRFVPTHDGFVHARLTQGSDDSAIPVPVPVPAPIPVPVPVPVPVPDAAPAPPPAPDAASVPAPDAAP